MKGCSTDPKMFHLCTPQIWQCYIAQKTPIFTSLSPIAAATALTALYCCVTVNLGTSDKSQSWMYNIIFDNNNRLQLKFNSNAESRSQKHSGHIFCVHRWVVKMRQNMIQRSDYFWDERCWRKSKWKKKRRKKKSFETEQTQSWVSSMRRSVRGEVKGLGQILQATVRSIRSLR